MTVKEQGFDFKRSRWQPAPPAPVTAVISLSVHEAAEMGLPGTEGAVRALDTARMTGALIGDDDDWCRVQPDVGAAAPVSTRFSVPTVSGLAQLCIRRSTVTTMENSTALLNRSRRGSPIRSASRRSHPTHRRNLGPSQSPTGSVGPRCCGRIG